MYISFEKRNKGKNIKNNRCLKKISKCGNSKRFSLGSFNKANFRILSYILLYIDENFALKLAKKYVFVSFQI